MRLNLSDFTTDNHFYDKFEGSDTLVVLFNYYSQPLTVRSHHNFIKNAKCSKLFLHSGADDWFQNGMPDIADSFEGLMQFCANLRDVFPEKNILFIGHSMGAYAALACGIAARADRILASVPEIELRKPGSVSLGRLPAEMVKFPSIRDIIASNPGTPISVIAGRQNAHDIGVAEDMQRYPHVSAIELDCGHETFPYLRDKGVLEKVFLTFIDGGDLSGVVSGL